MLNINKKLEDEKLYVALEGRLDTTTSPELEKEIQGLGEATELTVDFAKLDYISSAGLRVLLSAHKNFARKGGMSIINVNDVVLEIFDVTGFKDILNIK